jgi:hypothetical protein
MNESRGMVTATNIAQWVVRLTGMTQVLLGVLFWTGRALALLPLHMAVGVTFVLGLWTLAGLAAQAGLRRVLVLLAVVWGLVVPTFGMVHARLLPGSPHWIARVSHLLIGIFAMIMAAALAGFVRRHPASREPEWRTARVA